MQHWSEPREKSQVCETRRTAAVNYPKMITHSGPKLDLCEDTDSWPRSCLHLPGHVLDQGTVFLMGR